MEKDIGENVVFSYIKDKSGKDIIAKQIFGESYIITSENKLLVLGYEDENGYFNRVIENYKNTDKKTIKDFKFNKKENINNLIITFTDGTNITIKDIGIEYWSMTDKKMIEIK